VKPDKLLALSGEQQWQRENFAGICFAQFSKRVVGEMKAARTAVFFFRTICLSIYLAAVLSDADAFSEPLLRAEPNRKVIVFDNDYLDRRFRRDRLKEAEVSQSTAPAPSTQAASVEGGPQVVDISPARRPAEVMPNSSFLRGITRATPPRRAAALRLAENGRTLLQSGQPRKAIYYLEKALGMEASPFVHFYLARKHYDLADNPSAQRFLEVAEAGLFGQADWLPELSTLKEAISGSAAYLGNQRRDIAWAIGR